MKPRLRFCVERTNCSDRMPSAQKDPPGDRRARRRRVHHQTVHSSAQCLPPELLLLTSSPLFTHDDALRVADSTDQGDPCRISRQLRLSASPCQTDQVPRDPCQCQPGDDSHAQRRNRWATRTDQGQANQGCALEPRSGRAPVRPQ